MVVITNEEHTIQSISVYPGNVVVPPTWHTYEVKAENIKNLKLGDFYDGDVF